MQIDLEFLRQASSLEDSAQADLDVLFKTATHDEHSAEGENS